MALDKEHAQGGCTRYGKPRVVATQTNETNSLAMSRAIRAPYLGKSLNKGPKVGNEALSHLRSSCLFSRALGQESS